MSASLNRLQRVKLLVQIGASIAIPVVIAIVGWLVQSAVSDAGLKKDYVQMALGVLQQKPSEENRELRMWAIAVLAEHSPVEISAELKDQLVVRQIASSSGFAPMSPLEGRTNRHGSDLTDSGFQVNVAEECSEMCAKNSRCMAMTFVKHTSSHGGICWLKGAVPSATADEMMTSAVKVISKVGITDAASK